MWHRRHHNYGSSGHIWEQGITDRFSWSPGQSNRYVKFVSYQGQGHWQLVFLTSVVVLAIPWPVRLLNSTWLPAQVIKAGCS